MGSYKQNIGIKLEKSISHMRGVFDNGNVNWCMLGRAFLCRTGHLCVKPGFLCQTMHFAVEPGFLVSNECYNHCHGSHRGFYAKEIQLQCEYTGAMPPSHQAIDVRITERFLIFIILSQHCGCWWPVALLFQDRPATATVLVSIDFLDINRTESTVYKQIRYK